MLDWLRYRYNHLQWRHIAANVAANKSEKLSHWRFLNQPFTLWLLSALVISLWSTYHSTSQQCHEQADKIYSDVVPLLDEIGGRFRELRQQFDKTQDEDDPEIEKILRGQTGFQTNAFKDQSLTILLRAYNNTARKIAAKLFPQVVVSGELGFENYAQVETNPGNDITINDIWTHIDRRKSDFLFLKESVDHYRMEIEERRSLIQLGTKVNQCSFGGSSRCPRLVNM